MKTRLITFLSVIFIATASYAQPLAVGSDSYAFFFTGDPDLGLYFSGTNSRYEFRDLDANPEFWVNPISGVSHFRGKVGIMTTTPVCKLDVLTNSDPAAVSGRNRFGPTNGYLGVQGASGFDGIGSLNIAGTEVGVLGVSTGGSTVDNYGVYGHSNGKGIFGEHSTSGLSAAIGTSSYSIEASGIAKIKGGSDVEPGSGGYLILGNENSKNLTLDNNEIQVRDNGSTGTLLLNFDGGDISAGSSTSGGGKINFRMNSTAFSLNGATGNIGINRSGANARTRMEVLHEIGGPNNGLSITNETGDQNGWNLYSWSTGDLAFYCNDGATGASTLAVRFECDGTILTPSDIRFKEDFKPLASSLDKVLMLNPVSYYMKNDKIRETRTLGFKAQEIREVIPDVVSEAVIDELSGETKLMMSYDEIIPVLVAAIQEQNSSLMEDLEQKDKEISELRSQIQQIVTAMDDMDSKASLDSPSGQKKADLASLGNCTPNPSTGTTSIPYSLPDNFGKAQLIVADVTGRVVQTLDLSQSGNHKVSITTSQAGQYYCTLFVDSKSIASNQFTIVK